jgi:hypothetical protein
MFCTKCGHQADDEHQFCGNCSAPLRPEAAPARDRFTGPAAEPAGRATNITLGTAVTWRSEQVWAGLPAEVWAVIGLIAYAASYFVITGLDRVGPAFDAMGFSFLLGLALLIAAATGLLIGAAIGAVGWLVYKGETEAQILAMISGALLLCRLIYAVTEMDTSTGFWATLLIVAAIAWTAGVVMLPAVNDWFARQAGRPTGTRPLDVGIAQRLGYLLAALLGLIGLIGLLVTIQAGNDAGGGNGELVRGYLTSILMLVAGGAAFRGAGLLDGPATVRRGRLLLTGACAAALVAVLVTGTPTSEGGFVLGLAVVTAAGLWAREDVRTYFETHHA